MKTKLTRNVRRRRESGLLVASPFLMPSLIGLMIFSFLPLVISALISLTDWNGLDKLTEASFLEKHFIGLQNYKAILTAPEFWRTLGNTAQYIVLYIPLMLAASLLVASLLSRSHRCVGVFRVLYYIPVLTSWVAASLIWKSVLSPQYGALNGILKIFGIQGPGWLQDEAWAMPAIVLVSVWKDMGFFGLILLSGIVGINKTYYEAASLDGAGGLEKIHQDHAAAADPIHFLCSDRQPDQRLPAFSTDHDYDRRRTQRRNPSHGGADLQLRFPLLPYGLRGGVFLAAVCHYYGVHSHSDEGAE